MNLFKRCCFILFLCSSFSLAKNTYSSFSLGWAIPVSSRNAETPTGLKALENGWAASWTFFGKPLTSKENALSSLAFGGKISYSRWLRDSTATPVTFLGVQAITRYYLPQFLKPINTFAEAGAGLFIGEYAFTSIDTMSWSSRAPQSVVFKGKRNFGYHIGIGINWDVVEIVPILTVVTTHEGLSAWLAINAGMTF